MVNPAAPQQKTQRQNRPKVDMMPDKTSLRAGGRAKRVGKAVGTAVKSQVEAVRTCKFIGPDGHAVVAEADLGLVM